MFERLRPTGVASDSSGGPVVDPTKNVIDLVNAETKRQDDLREASHANIDSEIKSIRRELQNFKTSLHENRKAEAERINAIRAVDVGAVAVANTAAEARALALAKQVTDAAAAQSIALKAETDPIRKDIADLRQSQYTLAGGKQEIQTKQGNWGLWMGVAAAVIFGAGTILFNTIMLAVTLYLGLK